MISIEKIKIVLKKYNAQYQKINEQPWGTYEAVVSFDGINWFYNNRRYGWGFKIEDVIAELIQEQLSRTPIDQNLLNWLGPDKYKEIIEPDKWIEPKALLPPTT